MKRLKRVFALFLVFVLFLNSSLTGYAADDADASYNAEVSVGDEDFSGQMYEEIFGDGSAYQVLDMAQSEDGSGFDVTYTASAACIGGSDVFDGTHGEFEVWQKAWEHLCAGETLRAHGYVAHNGIAALAVVHQQDSLGEAVAPDALCVNSGEEIVPVTVQVFITPRRINRS